MRNKKVSIRGLMRDMIHDIMELHGKPIQTEFRKVSGTCLNLPVRL